ncbi:MAG: hypothetical protein KF691_00685 [Phycisphaeraceae bacterium]|nr:hypothetical protein [Phycisphaeraceae bacterium]
MDNTSGCPALTFQGGTQSIEGTGQVVVSSVGNYGTILDLTNQASLTIGPEISLVYAANSGGRGPSLKVGTNSSLTNLGTITLAKPGSQITIEGAGTFTNRGTLDIQAGTFASYSTKDDVGKIQLGANAVARIYGGPFTLAHPLSILAGAELVVDGAFSVEAPIHVTDARLELSGYWSNTSTIESLRSTTLLLGTWTNGGSLSIKDSDLTVGGFIPDLGEHQFTHSSLTYSGTLPQGITLVADESTGDINLASALLNEAELETRDGAKFHFRSSPFSWQLTTLTACRLDGEFALAECVPVYVRDGLTLLNGARIELKTGCFGGLTFEGFPQSLAGDGELLAIGPGSIIVGATTSALTIQNAHSLDVGQYSVAVSTPCSAVTSDSAWLRYCHGDFNSDLAVDDADFTFFALNYDILDCTDPAMPPNCPGDYNADGLVDDADFTSFVVAYDTLVCPFISVCRCSTPAPTTPPCDFFRCR